MVPLGSAPRGWPCRVYWMHARPREADLAQTIEHYLHPALWSAVNTSFRTFISQLMKLTVPE